MQPFLTSKVCTNVEPRNCFEDILMAFTSDDQSLSNLARHNTFIFHRIFNVKSLYTMSTTIECSYTSFKNPEVCSYNDPVKVHIIENFEPYCQILVDRGLEPDISRYFVAAMLTSNLPADCIQQLGSRLHNTDLELIRSVYIRNIVKDGESPIRILNGISERQQQKNLNVKRPKATQNADQPPPDIAPDTADTAPAASTAPAALPSNYPVVFHSVDEMKTSQYYLYSNNFNHFYIVRDFKLLQNFINNSKQYVQAFQSSTQVNAFIVLTRDRKLENSSKRKQQLEGGDIANLPVVFEPKTLQLFNVSNHVNTMPKDQWFLPFNENYFLDLQKYAMKTITMQIKPKYYEFRFYCRERHLKQLIASPAYKYIYMYEKHDAFDILENTQQQWVNVSFYIYYLDVGMFCDKTMLPIFKNDATSLMLTTHTGVLQLGLLYTTYSDMYTSDEMKSDNAQRFLYMKQTNSMHPYPDSQENAELLNSIKVKIRISEITNSKIEGSKHLHDGAMGAILSERGLYVTSEKKTHDKWFKHEDARSGTFFNEPPLQNCQNPKLAIKFGRGSTE